MNKQDLISTLASMAQLKKADVSLVLDTLARLVHTEMGFGNEITLPGICKIGVTTRAARIGHNPFSGEAVAIPAKRVPVIKALKALKDASA